MKKFKLISLLIIAVMVLGCLASCGEVTTEEMIAKADKALLNGAYSADVEIAFTTDNPMLKEIFAALNAMEMEFAYSNGNAKITSGMNTEVYGMTVESEAQYVVVDDVIYLKNSVSVGGESTVVKQKANVTDLEKEDFLSENVASMDVTSTDFETVERKEVEKTTVISCEGLKQEAEASLNELMKDMLGELDGSISVKNVKLVVEIENGKYDEVKLSCDYVITAEGESVTFGFVMTMDYDFDETVVIEAPQDASSYETVDFSELEQGDM